MSFAYYSSGERDEETGEYIKPERWDHYSESIQGSMLKQSKEENPVSIPPEFDPQYFIDKRNSARTDSEAYDWLRYGQYANTVRTMFSSVAYRFYTKYSQNIDELQLPEYILQSNTEQDIDLLAKNLDNSEKNLVSQFARNNRTVQAKINKHKRLENLQNYAVRTWLMYHILNHSIDIPLKNSLRFKAVYKDLDQGNQLDLLRIYRGCKILERNFRIYLRPTFMENQGHYLYKDVDISRVYDDIVRNLGGITAKQCQGILSSIRPKIFQMKNENREAKYIINFYHYFDDIQRTIYEIKRIGAEWKESGGWNIFQDSSYGDDIDVYLRGKKYKTFCTEVAKACKNYDKMFIQDVNKVIEELSFALTDNSSAYISSRLD